MMKSNRFSKFLLLFFTIIIGILVIGFIINEKYRFIYNAVFIYIAYLLIILYVKKEVISITNFVKSLLILVAILHLAFGQYLNFYKTSIYFDKILHLIGTFTISLFIYQVLVSLVGEQLGSRFLVFILISSIGITFGVFLEILEFAIDIIFNASNQYGLVDTNVDLIFNVFGASFAGYIVAIKY